MPGTKKPQEKTRTAKKLNNVFDMERDAEDLQKFLKLENGKLEDLLDILNDIGKKFQSVSEPVSLSTGSQKKLLLDNVSKPLKKTVECLNDMDSDTLNLVAMNYPENLSPGIEYLEQDIDGIKRLKAVVSILLKEDFIDGSTTASSGKGANLNWLCNQLLSVYEDYTGRKVSLYYNKTSRGYVTPDPQNRSILPFISFCIEKITGEKPTSQAIAKRLERARVASK